MLVEVPVQIVLRHRLLAAIFVSPILCHQASSDHQGSRGPPWSWSWPMRSDVLHRATFSGNQRYWRCYSQLSWCIWDFNLFNPLYSSCSMKISHWSIVGIFALEYWSWTFSAVIQAGNAKSRRFSPAWCFKTCKIFLSCWGSLHWSHNPSVVLVEGIC